MIGGPCEMSVLTAAQRRFWEDNGFLVVPEFFNEQEIATTRAAYDRVWTELPGDVVIDTEVTHRRVRARDVTAEERGQSLKINDLYLVDERIRQVILSARIVTILAELLGEAPVVCNTLSMEYGSQAPDHLDTLYMPPVTEGALAATWMALDDVHPDAGPLRYYPESNHIEPYRFRTGAFKLYSPEMEAWRDYMAGEVDRYGLEETRFLAHTGDLFIWDAWLLHGGAEICRPGLTRHSLVTHFFTESDCCLSGSDLQAGSEGGWWMRRSPQAVPGEKDAARTTGIAQEPEEMSPTSIGDRTPPLKPATQLRERLDATGSVREM
jgi:phytanoyl-CoA hydroxylase